MILSKVGISGYAVFLWPTSPNGATNSLSNAATYSDLIGWAVLAFGVIALMAIASRNAGLRKVLIVAFLLRAAVAVLGYYFITLPDSASDAAMFYRQATEWGAHGWAGVAEEFRTGAYLYPSLMAGVFQLTGNSQFLMLAINVCLGTLIVLATYRLAELIAGEATARVAGWVTALWPTLVLYSAVSLREEAIVLPFVVALVYLMKWRSTNRMLDLSLAFLFFYLATLFHTGIGAGLIAAGIVAAVAGLAALSRLHRSLAVVRYLPMAVLALGLAALILTSGIGLEKIGGSLEGFGIDNLAQAAENRATARAKYLEGYQLASALDLVTQAPVRIGYFMFSPFPWAISSSFDLVGLVDAALYLILVILIIVALRTRSAQRRDLLVLLFVAGTIIYLFAFVTSNSGTAVRHRAKLAPVLIVAAAVAVPRVRRFGRGLSDPIVRYGLSISKEKSQ